MSHQKLVVGEILRRCNKIAFTEYCTDESCPALLLLLLANDELDIGRHVMYDARNSVGALHSTAADETQ
eukprot:scaffold39082_cov150-Skeletonema_marinoi.AAC.6